MKEKRETDQRKTTLKLFPNHPSSKNSIPPPPLPPDVTSRGEWPESSLVRSSEREGPAREKRVSPSANAKLGQDWNWGLSVRPFLPSLRTRRDISLLWGLNNGSYCWGFVSESWFRVIWSRAYSKTNLRLTNSTNNFATAYLPEEIYYCFKNVIFPNWNHKFKIQKDKHKKKKSLLFTLQKIL